MTPLRLFTGNTATHLFPFIYSSTANDIDDELWLMLKSYSHVKNRGMALAIRHGALVANKLVIWKRFSGYIEVADEFWRTARISPWQSSALSYYYCFLNLAKAYLVLRDFNMPPKIGHGLSYDPQNLSLAFSSQSVKRYDRAATGSGSGAPDSVFKRYYEAVTNSTSSASNNSFNIKTLLAYCADIGMQYDVGGFWKA